MRFPLTSLLVALATAAGAAMAQEPAAPAATPAPGAPVVVRGDTILLVPTRLGSFTAAERAEAIAARVMRLANASVDSLVLVPAETSTDIVANEVVVMTVSDADAAARGMTRDALAAEFRAQLSEVLGRVSLQETVRAVLFGLLKTLIATLAMLLLLRLLRRGFARLEAAVASRRGSIPSLRIKTLELVPATVLGAALDSIVRFLRFAALVLLFYFYVPLVLTFFPWTERYADRLVGYVLTPVTGVLTATVAYLPNILFIAVIVVATRYLLKAIRLVFDALGRGTLALGGFEPEWADPTYNIVRFLIGAFALVVIFPYLPGANSDAFRGVSIFLGALLSFGSSSAISNAIAGVVLTYTRAFRIGDRIAIGDTVGDVTARTLLVTRVRTIKQVEVTVPNALVLSTHVRNYTTLAREGGLILHTGVTIGYDVPWRQVHELLIAAARATKGLSAEPAPFVHQTSLDDFYVSYQLNAYTTEPQRMAAIYSALHENIQDGFAKAGVEIMSPHYAAHRDGSVVTIPGSKESAPPFRVRSVGEA